MSTKEHSRFRFFEKNMTIAVGIDAAAFVLFLLGAGFGITWLKIIAVIGIVAVSVLGLVSLYLTGELFRLRSRWIAASFCALLLCMLVSLLLHYPAPAPAAIPSGTEPAETTALLPFILF